MYSIKWMTVLALLGTASVARAQDVYDMEHFSTNDLNGTARYVGMGGAMAALGGDLSVMGTNPAGVGVYRTSDVALTGSLLITNTGGVIGYDAVRASMDNAGIVFSTPVHDSPVKFVNYGVNYAKRKNFFGNIDTGVDNLFGAYSQTHQIAGMANATSSVDEWGTLIDLSVANKGKHDGIITANQHEEDGKIIYDSFEGMPADEASYQRHTYGSIAQTDINAAVNINDRFFAGVSVGIYSINYNRDSRYFERGMDDYAYRFDNFSSTDGDGVDIKLGVIARPFANSPFRIGAYLHTPTWYNLTDLCKTTLTYDDGSFHHYNSGEYDYRYHTPWKVGVGIGHTVGRSFAIDVDYEYSDLSACRYRLDHGGFSDYFSAINKYAKYALNGQHTIKAGVEFKPIPSVSLRLGYNWVSSPFNKNAYRQLAIDDPETETAFTNWKATNRLTCGVGFRFKGGYFDLAYQYQIQKGDFYAFGDQYVDDDYAEVIKPTSVNNNRSQVMCTLGFKF